MGRLDRRKLVFAESLAHNIEPGGKRCVFVADRAAAIAAALDDSGHAFHRIDELRLRLGHRGGKLSNRVTGGSHGRLHWR
jgi:hypothetical protein